MYGHSHDGFFPLSQHHVEQFIPASPGAFSLAVRLASGAHYSVYSAESEDLQESLRRVYRGDLSGLPPSLHEYLERFQCYISYYVFQPPAHGTEIQKMLQHTNDPIVRLRVICSN
jgi:hypothetical protein